MLAETVGKIIILPSWAWVVEIWIL